jgi:hypothetical protein
MARYLARPPIATDRLPLLDDGRLELRLKRALARRDDGASLHAARAAGAFGRDRASSAGPPHALLRCLRAGFRGESGDRAVERARHANAAPTSRRRRAVESAEGAESVALGLPDLADISAGRSRMRALQGADGDRSAADTNGAVARVLGHLGLSAEAPGFHPARPPPQGELPFADEVPDFVADAPAPEDLGA